MHKIGERVGAMASADETTAFIFGYGVYEGEEIPTPDVVMLGRRYIDLCPGNKNPKIKLDNGKVVYGCECWWGDEETMKRSIAGRKVEVVNIDDYRKEGAKLLTENILGREDGAMADKQKCPQCGGLSEKIIECQTCHQPGCVEECIPGGQGTKCVSCEQDEGMAKAKGG